MKISMDKKRMRFYLWVGLAYLLISIISTINSPHSFLSQMINNTWLTVYLIALNYILFEHAFPFVKLNWKRILLFLLLLYILLMFYSFGLYVWKHLGIQLHIYTPFKSFESFYSDVEDHMSYSMGSIFFFGIIKHIYDYRNLRHTAQQLRIEKQLAELNYLKAQTNPHFLFNTLNNIYSLARDGSELAPESILRLSKILRFMLYETGGEFISIEKELKIISDFIALEKLRYDESLLIDFNYDIEDMKQAIPPLLLIPLVENAFKHGVSETRTKPFVNIHLSVKKRQLTFFVKNSTEEFSSNQNVKENIGLSNLRRQLELLYTDYDLEVQQEESMFKATLKINLASHV